FDSIVGGDELTDLEIVAAFPAQGRGPQEVQKGDPASGVNRPVRRELAARITAPAHEAKRATLVTDREFGEIAPPSFGRVDLKALPLAGGREHQHLDLAGVADEAGRGHDSEPAASDMGGWPAQARK